MKKLLLLGLAFTAGLELTQAQQTRMRVPGIHEKVSPKLTLNDNTPNRINAPKKGPSHKVMAGGWGTQLGYTYYDLMTNSAIGNRILRHNDGSVSATWIETCSNSSGAFTNRGAGYNYYNPTTQTWVEGTDGTCPDNFGIASVRLGWPEIVLLGNGNEAIIGHSGTGVALTKRSTKGTGGLTTWGATTDISSSKNIGGNGNNGTWPRVVSNGDNIHMIYCVYSGAGTPVVNGVENPMVYNRSTNGGTSWDKVNVYLPGMTGANFSSIGGDDYAIAVKGNTVAIVAGGSFGQPWTMWKSLDNGNTWTSRLISKVTASDTLTVNTSAGKDTVALVTDGNHAIVIDNNNNVHVWGGTMCANVDVKIGAGGVVTYAPTGTYYPNVPGLVGADSLRYWTDAFPVGKRPIRVAGVEDIYPVNDPLDWVGVDDNASTPYRNTGWVSMANSAVHSTTNDIYTVYAAVVEGASNTTTDLGQPFRDLYIVKRWANGDISKPINISGTILNAFGGGAYAAMNFEENVYPSVSHEIGADNLLHMLWMSDDEPGTTLSADADAEHQNLIMYKALNVSAINFIVAGVKDETAAYVNNISAFPNPATDKVAIQIDLKKSAKVNVRLANVLGQEVAGVITRQIVAGNHDSVVELNMAGLAKGVYTYTVSSDNFTVTKRIVKQ